MRTPSNVVIAKDEDYFDFSLQYFGIIVEIKKLGEAKISGPDIFCDVGIMKAFCTTSQFWFSICLHTYTRARE